MTDSVASSPKNCCKSKQCCANQADSPCLRRATIADVLQIQSLINSFAEKDEMLARSLNELYENIRDYFVLESNSEIVGTVACHVNWEDLAEVKSLAVAENLRGQGLGRKLLEACVVDARDLGLKRLFALSYKPEFFKHHGWREVDKSELPHKVWAECIRCVKFPNCGETALVLDLDDAPRPRQEKP
jgi:amino-acid N-acetyltransferase